MTPTTVFDMVIGAALAGFIVLIYQFGYGIGVIKYNDEILRCQKHLQQDERCHMIAVPEQITPWTVEKMMNILSKAEQ